MSNIDSETAPGLSRTAAFALAAAAGLAVVDTLGVRGGSIHSDQEYLLTASLVERARLSALILMRLAQGAWDGHGA